MATIAFRTFVDVYDDTNILFSQNLFGKNFATNLKVQKKFV